MTWNRMQQRILIVILLAAILVNANTFKAHGDDDDRLQITINRNGTYKIDIDQITWLSSSDTFLNANGQYFSVRENTLQLSNYGQSLESDVLGSYLSVEFSYNAMNYENIQMDCEIRVYQNIPLIRFVQTFKNEINGMKTDFDSVSTSFPSFDVKPIQNQTVGYLSFGGMMSGDMEKIINKWGENFASNGINHGMQGGPLVLFNENGDTIVLSPMSSFMSSSMGHIQENRRNSINFGIMGGVDTIEAGYSTSFALYYGGNGVNNALKQWGNALLKLYGKTDEYVKTDFTNNYLGYWTDNGAYYYWLTEPGKNYQDTMLDVVAHFNSLNIPFKYLQYDSWWYGGPLGTRGGCSKWDTPANIFPDGMAFMFNATKQLPVSAHNKYWDPKVVYAKQHGGAYNFLIDNFTMKALPNDDSFWNDLFKNASQWGLKTYEQDWLNHQTLDFNPLLMDASLGREWLLQMGLNAQKYNVTVQYCMSLSRHVLQSVEIPAVTQVRVTNDYATNWQYGGEQWRLGVSSIFAYAVGLAPFKDVFWSTSVQPGNRYGRRAQELYPELESAISTLTSGPVGPGDRIGYMNKDIIMRCCNDDGLILKPSKPITATDSQIYATAFERRSAFGEVWSTYSQVSNLTYGIVFAADMKGTFLMTPAKTGFDVPDNAVYWSQKSYESVTVYSNSQPIPLTTDCTKKNFCLYYVAPYFSIGGTDIALLGEKSKWVNVSPQRVTSIQVNTDSLVVYANGVMGESITFSFWINQQSQDVTCLFTISALLKITATKDGVECI